MNIHLKNTLILIIVLLSFSSITTAQENNEPETDSLINAIPQKGFHAGLYIGGYWANRNTAYLYDGYGFDQNGQRNDFANSILRNQIVNVYGAAQGGTDLIAQLLNVGPNEWSFTENDMPLNLRYTTTYQVGLNTRYQIDKKSSILLNINAAKLVVNGKFTISSNGASTGLPNQIKLNQFTIVGGEQRLGFQFGYQKVLGKHEKLNVMVEGGLNFILSKVQKNQAFLAADPNSGQNNSQNNITIDLMTLYNQPPYNFYASKYFVGVGIGAFGGVGLHLTFNPKYTIQLLYTPSYDRIGLGYNPNFKLQHGIGLRVYYNLS